MVINDETLASFINKGCVTLWLCHLLKMYLKAKEELWNSNISPCKNTILKNPLKETKILQDIITL
jgi:hypothetical protein